MAYYLAVERKVNSYEAINIKGTKKGKEIFPKTNGDNYACTLEEIDVFTMQYDSLQTLKYALYSEHKIPSYASPIAIVYAHNEKFKITDNILLSSSKDYLLNPNLVLEYLINTFRNNDIIFAKQLLETLPNNNPIKEMLDKLIKLMEESQISNTSLDTITTIAKHLVSNDNQEISTSSSISLDYKKFHDIVAFIINYQNNTKSKNKTKTKIHR